MFRRAVIVKEAEKLEDKPLDVISSEFSARTLTQEYGGGAFAARDNVIIFSNYKDQRLYKQTVGGEALNFHFTRFSSQQLASCFF